MEERAVSQLAMHARKSRATATCSALPSTEAGVSWSLLVIESLWVLIGLARGACGPRVRHGVHGDLGGAVASGARRQRVWTHRQRRDERGRESGIEHLAHDRDELPN